ncbi:MAG: DUF4091 domain-containing protein [Planctomycetes bacterium]|nr:DUF4091 domain-containing protein [Planctomycetota bacterium]
MRRVLVVWFVGVVVVGTARCQEPSVWVASPWEHVLRETPPGEQTAADIVAGRNEYECFRVIVRAGSQSLANVTVAVGPLTGSAGRIEAGHVALFREHYIHVVQSSPRSKAPVGWYPDALIPFAGGDSLSCAAAKYPALPMRVEPETNQGVWVDVFVPRDTAPGEYAGTITVAADGGQLGAVPVRLRVLPFTLPDEIAMRSNFGGLGGRLARQLGMEPGSPAFVAVEDQYIDLLLAHRAIPSSLGNIWPTWTPEGGIDDSRSGERLRTMVEDRHVNALSVPFAYRTEPEKCRAYLRDLAAYLRGKGWLDLAYIYLEDEPNNAEQYETVRQQGELIRESGIKRLCTEQTVTSNPAWGDLYGAVDIWCPLWCLYDETTARQRQLLGEEIWTYTALCQGDGRAPFWQIDFPPVHFRAPFWISWHHEVKGFLYWSSIYGTDGQDPWTTPHFRDQFWGEGMLLYPGKDAGLTGPVPSIRLKLVREALEDFETMTLATKQGHRAEVDGIVGTVARSFTDWSHDADAYAAARERIAALITGE